MPQFDIDAATIRTLADLMIETGLSEIELSEGERRIRVSRQATVTSFASAAPARQETAPAAAAPAIAPGNHPGAVNSPMVGTAYLQGEPGAPPFAPVGAAVRAGDTLLIIEAMKVMNPIKAPRAGIVTKILVADGQPVEYGEPLLIVE
jgi:acetyl-CoA carboxylase biotin carboxyl carrier protein